LGPAIKRTERPLGTVSGSEDLKGNVLKGFPLDLPEGGNIRAINIEEHLHHHSCEGRETTRAVGTAGSLISLRMNFFIASR
jgi:hypothetical protein